ncbi:MAG: hypothetical protein ACYDDZ_15620 [Acidimicrobiales bacterium]
MPVAAAGRKARGARAPDLSMPAGAWASGPLRYTRRSQVLRGLDELVDVIVV